MTIKYATDATAKVVCYYVIYKEGATAVASGDFFGVVKVDSETGRSKVTTISDVADSSAPMETIRAHKSTVTSAATNAECKAKK